MKRKVTHAAIVERIFRKIEPDNFVSVYIFKGKCLESSSQFLDV